MGDTLNWAKKDLIVNSINSMSDRSAQSLASAKNALALGNAKQDIRSVSGAMARVGARVDSQNNKKIYVYCYNPKVPYSSNFGDAYYVNTGYANCNGLAYPVYINGNYKAFDLSSVSIRGTWAVMIQKIPNSEVWGVEVLFPSPNSSDVMVWKDKDGNTVTLDADSWVIGSFILDIGAGTSNSITGLYMQSEAMTPTSFLKNRFMQVLNEASGSDTDDFTSWANAMGCDGVFKRLAALELFVNNFRANNIQVGNGDGATIGSGFRFRAVTYENGALLNPPIFDVCYDDMTIFRIDPTSGNIAFGNGFKYNRADNTIESTDKKVVIEANGFITVADGMYKGSLQCKSFSSLPREVPISPTTLNISASSAKSQMQQVSAYGDTGGEYRPVVHSLNANVKWFKKRNVSKTYGSYTITVPCYSFYNASMTEIGYVRGKTATIAGISVDAYDSTWENQAFTLTIGITSNVVFKLVKEDNTLSIGTDPTDLEEGELYYVADQGGTTGTLHVKL